MLYIMTTIGSYGDLFPILGIAVELRKRGHEVHLLAAETYRDIVEQKQIKFHPIIDQESHQFVANSQDFWDDTKGLRLVMDHLVIPSMETTFDYIEKHHIPNQTVVVSHLMNLGARIARDKLPIKLVTLHLAPIGLRSRERPVRYGPLNINRLPLWTKDMIFLMSDCVLYQLMRVKKINAFRKRLSLPNVYRLFENWIHSPDLVLGLFPSWFGNPGIDWPQNIRLATFPLYDPFKNDISMDDREIQTFPKKTLLFTFGSWMTCAKELFEQSIHLCEALGYHGIFLSRNIEQIPKNLPKFIKHYPYVPLHNILPHVEAIVHHGGVGTLAEAISANIPQIIVPHAHDQFDNAYRISEFKLGGMVSLSNYRQGNGEASNIIQSVLEDPVIRKTCHHYSTRLNPDDAIQIICNYMESEKK